MKIAGSTPLVTGANRGLGREFAVQLLERGANRVYATARDPHSVDLPGVDVLALDITDADAVTAAASAAGDVDLLVNNAGITSRQGLITGEPGGIRSELDTNVFGTLSMARAFAPVLARNGGGAILNVLSVLSWVSFAGSTAYSVGKAAEWSLTNGIRIELADQATLVTALYLGATDTDMMADADIDKNDPADVVRAALDGIEDDRLEVLADDASRQVKSALSQDPGVLYPQLVR